MDNSIFQFICHCLESVTSLVFVSLHPLGNQHQQACVAGPLGCALLLSHGPHTGPREETCTQVVLSTGWSQSTCLQVSTPWIFWGSLNRSLFLPLRRAQQRRPQKIITRNKWGNNNPQVVNMPHLHHRHIGGYLKLMGNKMYCKINLKPMLLFSSYILFMTFLSTPLRYVLKGIDV